MGPKGFDPLAHRL